MASLKICCVSPNLGFLLNFRENLLLVEIQVQGHLLMKLKQFKTEKCNYILRYKDGQNKGRYDTHIYLFQNIDFDNVL